MEMSLDGNVKYEKVEKGHVFFREGESAEAFYIVSSGKVACAKMSADRVVVLFLAGERELVGEDSVLGGEGVYAYGAVALEACEVVKIESSDVYSVVESKAEWIKNILEDLSRKIKNTADLIAEHRIEDDRLSKGEFIDEESLALVKSKLS